MAEVFDIQQQWFDSFGGLAVDGRVYYGKPNTDPTLLVNQIPVFSDRALTVATQLPNPQSIGGDGRVENKPWLNQRYSIQVDDRLGVTIFTSQDNGENPSTGQILALSNVQGINNITAETPAGITEYDDQQVFTLQTFAANTGDITINIDTVGAKSIKFNFNEEISPGFFQSGQSITFIYNSAEDTFYWIDSGRGISLLTNVAGDGDTITADGGPSIAGYVDQQIYSFKPNVTNSGAATLKVGGLPTVSIKVKGSELLKKQLLVDVPALAMFNSIGPVFELLNASGPVVFTVFTSGGTWTPKSQSTSALIFCIGGGGGGGGLSSSSVAGGGGGASGNALTFVNSLDASYTVTIGAAGAAGSSSSGGVGGTSSVGSIAVSPGGGGGGGNSTGSGGPGGVPSAATIVMTGSDGQSASEDAASAGGNGGASFIGGGGRGATTDTTPIVGTAPGSGGGGAQAASSSGASGAPGIVFIIEFS